MSTYDDQVDTVFRDPFLKSIFHRSVGEQDLSADLVVLSQLFQALAAVIDNSVEHVGCRSLGDDLRIARVRRKQLRLEVLGKPQRIGQWGLREAGPASGSCGFEKLIVIAAVSQLFHQVFFRLEALFEPF